MTEQIDTTSAKENYPKGYVFLDGLNRPYFWNLENNWLHYWHVDNRWVTLREATDTESATISWQALPEDQANLYHKQNQRDWT